MYQGREIKDPLHDDLHEASHLMYSLGTGTIFLERVYETALRILADFDELLGYKLMQELRFVV